MCGIFGLINHRSTSIIEKERFKEAAKLMHHRGPDAFGQWGIDNKIELAHLRLSIIDPTPGNNQPFFSNCSNYSLIFNGEIYNYVEIRAELQQKGYHFRTNGDTEVLLTSYIEWGEDCVNKFNGDWAFAIYNIKENILFCSRDRFGVKPFNYAIIDDNFIFSSEIKSIISYFPQLRTPNYNVIANFCRNSIGAQSSQTWFSGVFRLLPAHNITWINGKVIIKRYWDYPKKVLPNVDFEAAREKYIDLFTNAVKLRMRSDVPVGSTLSAGLDSSSIVSVLRKFYDQEHNTFTAVYNSAEFNNAEKTAFSTEIVIDEGSIVKRLSDELELKAHLIPIGSSDFCRNLSNVIYFMESGNSSPSTIPLAKIMCHAKKCVSVVMEGQGADELLSGYVSASFPNLILELLKRGKFRQARKEYFQFRKTYSIGFSLKLFIRLWNSDIVERAYHHKSGMENIFGPKLKKYTRIKDYPFEPSGFDDPFNKELYKSHTGGLVNLLHYGDAISLASSVESRLPFMDVNLVEYAFQLPYNFKMKDGLGKYIHRKAMVNIVPQFILENPVKLGFNTPLSQHFQSLESEGNKILLSETCLQRGIFDSDGLKQFIKDQISGKINNATILFRLLSVELWFRQFIDNHGKN